MANETWKFVQAKSKQAMKQVLGIRDEKTRMKVTPPLAVAPITQDDDMRWNPNVVAVAFWNSSYGAACDVAQGTPPRQRPAAAERAMAATGS